MRPCWTRCTSTARVCRLRLIDALAALWELPAPTVADVQKLPPVGASLALAHARLARAAEGARQLLTLLALLGRVASSRAAR